MLRDFGYRPSCHAGWPAIKNLKNIISFLRVPASPRLVISSGDSNLEEKNVKMIIGLGNPGKEYEETRHNIGFKVVELFAERRGLRLDKYKDQALSSEFSHGGNKVLVVKPQTFMNLSGQAVGSIARWHKIKPAEMLVVYDDLDLPVGKLRIRATGGAGGHNGIKSLIAHLHTEDFPRIRVGVGRPPAGVEVTDYVLSSFLPAERELINQTVVQGAEAIQMWLDKGLIETMNCYSK